jgi:D-alanyl-D-alanine carboxypeptidase (penicillin-binding protein 5/6)
MAVIACEAMKDPDFRKIAAAKSWKADRTDSDYLTFYNKNKTVSEYEGGNGIKIGYTKSSGRTLVASAERNGQTMICVVMSAPDWFNDAYRLMDYGFSQIK